MGSSPNGPPVGSNGRKTLMMKSPRGLEKTRPTQVHLARVEIPGFQCGVPGHTYYTVYLNRASGWLATRSLPAAR